jgi:hypothetical protein
MVTFYESSFTRRKTAVAASPKNKISSPSTRGQNLFRSVVSEAMRALDTRKDAVKDKYVVKVFGVYPKLCREKVDLLVDEFISLKDLMVNEEKLIKEARNMDMNANITRVLDLLEEQLIDLKKIFDDATLLIKIHEEIEKTRSKCVANGFRISTQFLLEMGSLAGSIIEAISSDSGGTNTAAKVAGFSLYMINITLSWINTGISKVRAENAKIFKDVKRLEGQKIFERHIVAMIRQGRAFYREALPEERKPLPILASLLENPPRLGLEGSIFMEKINQLYEGVLGGVKTHDWTKYMLNSSDAPSVSATGSRRLSSEVQDKVSEKKVKPRRQSLDIKTLYLPGVERVDKPMDICPIDENEALFDAYDDSISGDLDREDDSFEIKRTRPNRSLDSDAATIGAQVDLENLGEEKEVVE